MGWGALHHIWVSSVCHFVSLSTYLSTVLSIFLCVLIQPGTHIHVCIDYITYVHVHVCIQ